MALTATKDEFRDNALDIITDQGKGQSIDHGVRASLFHDNKLDITTFTGRDPSLDHDNDNEVHGVDAFSLSNLMEVGHTSARNLNLDFVDELIKGSFSRGSISTGEYDDENGDDTPRAGQKSSGFAAQSFRRAVMYAEIENARQLQQQEQQRVTIVTYDHYDPIKKKRYSYDTGEQCTIKPMYEDGTVGDNPDLFLTPQSMRQFTGTDHAPIQANLVSAGPGVRDKSLNNDNETVVMKTKEGKRFAYDDGIESKRYAVMIETVKGKDYFVETDGRHYQVKDGKKEFLEAESKQSRAKQAEFERKDDLYRSTGQSTDDLTYSVKKLANGGKAPVDDKPDNALASGFKKAAEGGQAALDTGVKFVQKGADDAIKSGAKVAKDVGDATNHAFNAAASNAAKAGTDILAGADNAMNQGGKFIANLNPFAH